MIRAPKQKKFAPTPEGLWPAVCIDVVDMGMVPTSYGPKHKIQFRWLADATPKREDGKPWFVSKKYNNSMHEKAELRKMLEVWRGRKFTKEEIDELDYESVLGAQCQIQVVHGEGEDGPFAYPQVVMKAAQGQKRMTVPVDYVREASRPGYKAPELPEDEPEYVNETTEYVAQEEDIPF